MSVTITIENNKQYCRENKLVKLYKISCDCLNDAGGMRSTTAAADCPVCMGEGVVNIDTYPFEMNLTNMNFRALMKGLGIDYTKGFVFPRRVMTGLVKLKNGLAERATKRTKKAVMVGVDREQAERYLSVLTQIAEEACRREEKIIWG